MRSRPCAGLDQRQAVPQVGPDRRDDHLRGRGQRRQRRRVACVGCDQGPAVRARRQRGTGALQLLPRPARQPDPHVRRRVLGEVRGHQRADEPGGAMQDDVVLTSAHPAILAGSHATRHAHRLRSQKASTGGWRRRGRGRGRRGRRGRRGGGDAMASASGTAHPSWARRTPPVGCAVTSWGARSRRSGRGGRAGAAVAPVRRSGGAAVAPVRRSRRRAGAAGRARKTWPERRYPRTGAGPSRGSTWIFGPGPAPSGRLPASTSATWSSPTVAATSGRGSTTPVA